MAPGLRQAAEDYGCESKFNTVCELQSEEAAKRRNEEPLSPLATEPEIDIRPVSECETALATE
jgi:hypothetical protein